MFKLSDGTGTTTARAKLARNLAIAMVGVIAGTNMVVGSPAVPLIIMSAALAVAATLGVAVRNPVGSVIIGVALAGQSIVFTASFAGHPWQIDSHMLFFVMLAVVAIMRCIPALLATAAVIAVHHVSFGALVPALVFPSSDLLVNLERVAMHAVVVVLEVAFLAMAILSQAREDKAKKAARDEAAAATAQVEAAVAEAEVMRGAAEAARAAALKVTTMLGDNLHAMAKQDLRARMDSDVSEEFQQVVRDYNEALDNVSRALGQAMTMVADVEVEASTSAEMTDSMARDLEIQAHQVTGAAESMRALTASLDTTSRDITAVRDRAQDAATQATDGGRIVRDAVAAMTEIKNSASEIEKIIKVIEEIAFQTNLLALNAGVEAARAGHAGAGFAVVASEVRALAHRTSEAAHHVKTLISSSVAQVATGAEMVDRAGVALDAIEQSVTDASGRVSDLTERSNEQSLTVRDISQNLAEIDTVIQACAARTEEISALGGRIVHGAQDLHNSLGGFAISTQNAPGLAELGPRKSAA